VLVLVALITFPPTSEVDVLDMKSDTGIMHPTDEQGDSLLIVPEVQSSFVEIKALDQYMRDMLLASHVTA